MYYNIHFYNNGARCVKNITPKPYATLLASSIQHAFGGEVRIKQVKKTKNKREK